MALQRQVKREMEATAAAQATVLREVETVAAEKQLVRKGVAGGRRHLSLPLPSHSPCHCCQLLAGSSVPHQSAHPSITQRLRVPPCQTDLQAALIKASLAGLAALDEEIAGLKTAAAQRERLARDVASQRDAAARLAASRLAKLREAVEAAELREAEAEELRRRRGEAGAARAELHGLCELMAQQAGRFQGLLAAARRRAADLGGAVAGAEAQLGQLEAAAGGRARELKAVQRERVRAEAARVLAANKLAGERRARLAAAEVADDAALERGRLARAAEEAAGGAAALAASLEAAGRAKEVAQGALLERDDELCALYERSAALESLLAEGAAALARCDDEVRALSLQAGELQRRLFATHKTAPDVSRYDRTVAGLKAELLAARREAEALGAALESPVAAPGRLRLLPGKVPPVDDLASRAAALEARLEARRAAAAQKDAVLAELAALGEAIVAQARASHGGAFDISVRLNDSQAALGRLARRMMAAVSELSLYSALALRLGSERDALVAAVTAARRAMEEGRPPTPSADAEFEGAEREAVARAEVRAQAAELRRLKEMGLLGGGGPSPRPQAYISEAAGGLPVPFPAAFRPLKPGGARTGGISGGRGGTGSPGPSSPGLGSPRSSTHSGSGLCVKGDAGSPASEAAD